MLDTERLDSGSDDVVVEVVVVLAESSAPESRLGGRREMRPATRSDMGLASRRRAVTS